MRIRPQHATDFYKTGHIFQYPDGTEGVYSNFTCRSDKLANLGPDFDHKVVFFGLQGPCQWLLRDLWNEEFFRMRKETVVARYKRRMDWGLGQGAVDVAHIAGLHDLGYLPVRIKALPEGSRVNIKVPPYTIQSTDPAFGWVTNYLETQLSSETWKAVTSATIAYEYRKLLTKYAKLTGSPLEFVPWQGHDFSARGMSGIHDAASTGAGHLTSFFGTDTVSAIDYLEDYYGADDSFVAGSVPATEHSVMCMGGEATEFDTIHRLITKVYPSGIVSIVSDTWDFWGVLTHTALKLKNEILLRRPNAQGLAKVVFRPDSGDPVKIIAGDPEAVPGSPEFRGAVECLWNIFGGTTTTTGHKLLHERVGIIYGDSITLDRARRILAALAAKGFASANVVFGIGSFTYQMVTRDTFGTAIKATHGTVNGEDRPLFKAPKTDSGTKNSARGLLRVEKVGSDFVLFDNQNWEQEGQGELQTVFEDGELKRFESIKGIRERLAS